MKGRRTIPTEVIIQDTTNQPLGTMRSLKRSCRLFLKRRMVMWGLVIPFSGEVDTLTVSMGNSPLKLTLSDS